MPDCDRVTVESILYKKCHNVKAVEVLASFLLEFYIDK